MDPSYRNMNHGSYGVVPKIVLEEQIHWRSLTEANPDKFFRFTVFDILDNSRKAMASFINANYEDVVFVENASEGLNSILRSIVTQPGTAIIYLDLEYMMVEQTMIFLKDVSDE